jgi:transcriptional regulator with XRE-family HTH domain
MCADQTSEPPFSRHFRNLGKALILLRELRHQSQRAVAHASGASTSQLSRYETGKILPKLETIENILDVLAIAPVDLFYLVALIDGWERRVGEDGDFRLPFPGSGLLTPSAFSASQKIIESLFTIQAEFVSERIGRGRGGLEEDSVAPGLEGLPPRFAEIEKSYRISLPEDIRVALRVQPGDLLGFEVVDGAVRISKLVPRKT